jgi:NitT/TauT family transport system ATP-binding protein
LRVEGRNIRKVFGTASPVTALDDISFTVKQGEFVVLLGPSGCGKSTLLNMVAGLVKPTTGEVLLDGEQLTTKLVQRKVGYVFQRDTVFPWRTVADNIGYGLELRGVPREERRERVENAIRQVGLDGFADHFPSTLSGGMRQRVGLMRTLIVQPEILLMDEPFAALDMHSKLEMHRILLDIWEKTRQSVVFVTHDLGEALTLADRILLFSARPGRIKECFEVDFPRPRDAVALRETQEWAQAFSHIWHSLGAEFRRTKHA